MTATIAPSISRTTVRTPGRVPTSRGPVSRSSIPRSSVPRTSPRSAPVRSASAADRVRVRPEGRPSAAAFRRRRVAAGVLGLALVFVTGQAADAVVHGDATGPKVQTIHYVVRSGDTLWSIARSIAPHDDPRAVVDLLVQANGGSTIEPGDVIDWAGR